MINVAPCTCSPSIINPACPVLEHRIQSEMAGLRAAGARASIIDDQPLMVSPAEFAFLKGEAPLPPPPDQYHDGAGLFRNDGQPYGDMPNHPIQQLQENGGKLPNPTINLDGTDEELARSLAEVFARKKPEDGRE